MLASFIKRQKHNSQPEFHAVILNRLHDIGDSIEIIAREVARQAKRYE